MIIGFQSFGGTTEIVSLKVVGGFSTYIAVDLVIALNNPSQITISAGDLVFDVIMDEAGSSVGSVSLTNTIIKPGRNEMSASMKMTGTDLAALSKLLTNYLTAKTTALTVKGTTATTKIIPLQPGLSQVALKTNMVGIPASLVVENQMKLVGLTPNIWVKFSNPLDTPYTVTGISAQVFFTNKQGTYGQLGTLVGAVDPPVTVPAKGTATNSSPLILKAGLAEAFQFLMLSADQKKVDLFQNVTMIVGEGFHGGMYYEQKGVPVVDKAPELTAATLAQAAAQQAAQASSAIGSSAVASTSATATSTEAASTTEAATATTTEAAKTTETAAPTTTEANATTTTAKAAVTTEAPTVTDTATTEAHTEPKVTAASTQSGSEENIVVLPF